MALLKTELRIPAVDTDADTEIGNLLDRSTAQIESYCGRQLVYRDAVGPYVEYHTIKEIRSVLFLNDFPVIGSPAIEVKESASSDWTVDALVNGTDYIVRKQRGVLQRVSAKSTPYQWQHGVRVVRVTYAGGYEDDANDKANVPQLLSDVLPANGSSSLPRSQREAAWHSGPHRHIWRGGSRARASCARSSQRRHEDSA